MRSKEVANNFGQMLVLVIFLQGELARSMSLWYSHFATWPRASALSNCHWAARPLSPSGLKAHALVGMLSQLSPYLVPSDSQISIAQLESSI
jgi:hypothetical protein